LKDKIDEKEERRILIECWREKKNAEKERNSTIRETGMPVKNEKIKSKSKMDECRAE
jgi:hypothetical protein